MAKTKTGDVSKSQSIRQYLAGHKRAKAPTVVAALAEKGIEVTPGLVHQVKGQNRTKRGGAKTVAKAPKSQGSLSVDSLIAAKKLADALGGVEKAKKLLDVLAKLG